MEAVAWTPHNGWRRQGVMCKILVSSSIGHGVLIDLNTVTGGGLMTNTEFTNDSLMAWLAIVHCQPHEPWRSHVCCLASNSTSGGSSFVRKSS